MTNYLTVRGDDTAFPGQKGVGWADIRGGSSNVIAVVEASDAKAVPWTKPDDLDEVLDETQPIAGVLDLWPNGFNAAVCDGNVRFIPATTDAETLRTLFDRNKGKAIGEDRR